jgi:acyl-CoA ligase (AMP-forming) (exosortase A-associated)
MTELLHELLVRTAERVPQSPALHFGRDSHSYESLAGQVERLANGLLELGLEKLDRVGIYLPKRPETVAAIFGTSRAGGVFVPVNPLLKAAQIEHILGDCNVRFFITSAARFADLAESLRCCPGLKAVIVLPEGNTDLPAKVPFAVVTWESLLNAPERKPHRLIDADMVSILYTSGSTGKPKGVVLSHRNMVTGAHSVAEYLENTAEDCLLAVLPFSFDYGFSQLSTAFSVGASVVLMDYLLPRDVISAAKRHKATGLAGVPPLWAQLAELEWPAEARDSLRYITNSGGAMPGMTLARLRASLPKTRPYLMYGLTEAFRSTYLPPEQVDARPDSMGRAIPNAEILVVRPDGTRCAAGEPGELVHRGSLVALGYWNDPVKTAERFKPVPGADPGLVLTEMAVWSGDTVRADEEGYLYFIGRRDEMIKTSGYRVSPTEIEEVVYATGLVTDAVAVGVHHDNLGQAIVIVAAGAERNSQRILDECRKRLPAYMIPAHIEWRDSLPRNPNGKFDRPRLAAELKDLFAVTVSS